MNGDRQEAKADPAVTNVVDSRGDPVSNGGITEDTVLTLSGIGRANSVVYIYDSGVLLTTASVTTNGTWRFIDTVALGRHEFTVRDEISGVDSPSWVITVVAVELDLQKPTVTQAPGGNLNPIDALNGATVVVTYDMLATDTIGLSWNGQDNLVPSQSGSASGSVTFTIPASAVAAAMGKTIPVLYAVVRNGVPKPSAVLDLTIQTLADTELEAPRILQAADDLILDVAALMADADLTVKPWPFIAEGQRISLRFEGSMADGSAHNWAHPTWLDLPITSSGEPTTTVALSQLQALKDGSSLKLIFEVSFDGGITTLLFPMRTLTIRARKYVSGFENWQSFGATGGHIFTLNVPLHCPSGLVATLIKDVPIGGPYTYVFNYGGSAEWALRVATGATIKFEFGGWINRLSFNHYWGIDNNWVNFYDEADNLVHVHHVVGQGSVDIILPRPCLWCWIAVYNASTGLGVDNIGWS